MSGEHIIIDCMASLSRATSRTTSLAIPAAMVVVGSLTATVATDVIKSNFYDVPIKGGDAVYPVAAALVLNGFMGRSTTVRYVTLGLVASSVTEIASSYGLV